MVHIDYVVIYTGRPCITAPMVSLFSMSTRLAILHSKCPRLGARRCNPSQCMPSSFSARGKSQRVTLTAYHQFERSGLLFYGSCFFLLESEIDPSFLLWCHAPRQVDMRGVFLTNNVCGELCCMHIGTIIAGSGGVKRHTKLFSFVLIFLGGH